MKRSFIIAIIILTALSTHVLSYAEEGPLDKLGRGLRDLTWGWLEIPRYVSEIGEQTNPLCGFIFGSIAGAGMGISRTGYGAADTATFLIPKYDKPMLEQKFVF